MISKGQKILSKLSRIIAEFSMLPVHIISRWSFHTCIHACVQACMHTYIHILSLERRIRTQGLWNQISSRPLTNWLGYISRIHTCMHAYTYIHVYWFNLDALAQGNTYKHTKKSINYRKPNGDWTRYLQTEATPPAKMIKVRNYICSPWNIEQHMCRRTGP